MICSVAPSYGLNRGGIIPGSQEKKKPAEAGIEKPGIDATYFKANNA
jgi:hypothetical protein